MTDSDENLVLDRSIMTGTPLNFRYLIVSKNHNSGSLSVDRYIGYLALHKLWQFPNGIFRLDSFAF